MTEDWSLTPDEYDNEYAVWYVYRLCEHYMCCTVLDHYAYRFRQYDSDYVHDRYQKASEKAQRDAKRDARAFDNEFCLKIYGEMPFIEVLKFAMQRMEKETHNG